MTATPRTLILGNSDGIGLALTRRLLAAGYDVTGVSRRPSPLGAIDGYAHVVADVAAQDYRNDSSASWSRSADRSVSASIARGLASP